MSKAQFENPLRFLHVVGFNPLNDYASSRFRRFISVLLLATLVLLVLLELFLNFDGLETCSRASESMVVQYQLMHKFKVLLTCKSKLAHLINTSSNFWDFDSFDGRFRSKNERLHQLLKRFFLAYKSMMVLMSLQFIFRKIIFKSDIPLVPTYGEKKGFSPTMDFLIFVYDSLGTIMALYVIIGFDGLFFYFVGHILSEVQMIKDSFEIIKYTNNDFVVSIKHHQFALRYIKIMNEVYSNLLLHQHISCLFGICFGLFLLSEDGMPPDLSHICKYVPYILSFITQTFMFCVIGSLIINWTSEIPNAIFHNGWNEDDTNTRHKYEKLIAINCSQQVAKLSLGEFGDLNLESFTLVIKNSYSFFAFINTMKDK